MTDEAEKEMSELERQEAEADATAAEALATLTPAAAPPPPPPPPAPAPATSADPMANLTNAVAQMAISSAAVSNLLVQLTRSAAMSDPYVSISVADKNLLSDEIADFKALDDTTGKDPHRPFGTDASKDAERNDLHRRRGRKIEAAKKSLPQDGYLNQSFDLDAWKTHPVVTANLSEADVRKSEPELFRFLDRKRWDVKFTVRTNIRQFRNKVQTTFYDEIFEAVDYQSYLTGSNVRFYVLEHFIFSHWNKRVTPSSERDPFGNLWPQTIPWRPDNSQDDPTTEVSRRVSRDLHDKYVLLIDQYSRWDSSEIPAGDVTPELFMREVPENVAKIIRTRHPNDPACKSGKTLKCLVEPLAKHKNQGFYRINSDLVRPVDPQFQRNGILSEADFLTLTRVLGKDMLTFTEQEPVRRDELPGASILLKAKLSNLPNALKYVVDVTVNALPEAGDERINKIRAQLHPMYPAFDPDLDPVHHLVQGQLAVNSAILRYATSDECHDEAEMLKRTHEVLEPMFRAVPPDRLTSYNRAVEEYVRNFRRRNDSKHKTIIPEAHINAFKSMHHLEQLMRDLFGEHSPSLRAEPRECFRVHVDDEPVLGDSRQRHAYLTAFDSSGLPLVLPGQLSGRDDLSSLYTDSTPATDAELMVGQTRNSAMSHGALSRGGNAWKQPLSYFEETSSRRSSGGRDSRQPSAWSRGRVRDAVRQRVARSMSPNSRGRDREPPGRNRFSHRSNSPDSRSARTPRGPPSVNNPFQPRAAALPQHPHSSHARQRLGGSSSVGDTPARSRLKPDGKEYLPPKAYSKLIAIRGKLRAAIDGSADLSSAMETLRFVKAETDEMLETMIESDLEDNNDDEHAPPPSADGDDLNDESINIMHDEDEIASEHPDMTPSEVQSVRMLSSETEHQLHMLGYDEASQEQRSQIVNMVLDRMQDKMPLEHFGTTLLSNHVEYTRANPHDTPVLLQTQTVLNASVRQSASHYDSCASACFEFSTDDLVPNSFREFPKDDAPKIATATGSDAADGMGFKRYHHLITDSMRADAAAAGFDLSDYDVFTSLMPPIVCTKFKRAYSIIGAPIARNVGYRYHQGRFDEEDTLEIGDMPNGKFLTAKLYHKTNGLPVTGLIPDSAVRSLNLRCISVHTLKPYRDVDALSLLKERWILKDSDNGSLYTEIFEACVSSMTHVMPLALPPASHESSASSDVKTMNDSPNDVPKLLETDVNTDVKARQRSVSWDDFDAALEETARWPNSKIAAVDAKYRKSVRDAALIEDFRRREHREHVAWLNQEHPLSPQHENMATKLQNDAKIPANPRSSTRSQQCSSQILPEPPDRQDSDGTLASNSDFRDDENERSESQARSNRSTAYGVRPTNLSSLIKKKATPSTTPSSGQILVGEVASSKGKDLVAGSTGLHGSRVSPTARKTTFELDTARDDSSPSSKLSSSLSTSTIPSYVSLFNKLMTVFTVALVGAGLCSELYFQHSAHSDQPNGRTRLPLNVSYIIEPQSDLQNLANSEARSQRHALRIFNDLRECVHNLESGKWSKADFSVQIITATLPCLRETVMNIHNFGSLKPVDEHEFGDLFVDYLARFCAIVEPDAVLCEMTPEHSHSDGSHKSVCKRFEQLGYSVHVTDRMSSAFCGDSTDRNRWFMLCFKLAGPSFDLLSYCQSDYSNAVDILDRPAEVSSDLWLDAPCEFRTRGKDTLPWGDEYPRDPRFLGQFISRAVLQGYAHGRRAKECKIWDVSRGPLPTVTRGSLLIVDGRTDRSSNVRWASVTECAKSMSFFPRQIAHLRRIGHDKAMEQIAGAVPCRTLYTVYACLLEQLTIRMQLHGKIDAAHLCSEIPDFQVLLNSIPRSLIVELPPDCIVDLMDTRIYTDVLGFLPQDFFRIDFDISDPALDMTSAAIHADDLEVNLMLRKYAELNHIGFDPDNITEIFETQELVPEADNEDESLNVKRTKGRRRINLDEVPIYRPPSKEYYAAYKRVNDWHRITHERDPAAIERIIATTTGHGLKKGDSRYLDDCDECSATIDTVQRTHHSASDGTARAPIGLRPGKKYMVDGGDATVRSKWGNFRYFLIFIDAKSSYIIIYYLRDNSAKSFVAALSYVDKLTRIRKGYGVESWYGDFFSSHLDQNVLGALRADKGWQFEVTPPYCHWLNGYCEVMMRVFKRDARVRLKSLLGVQWDDSVITDASPWWPFATEHALQYRTLSSSATIEHDFGVIATREQMFMEDITVMPQFTLMPFGSICYVILQQSRRFNAMTDTAERCIYLISGRYNPFSHAFADARQAHIVMRPNWRLQVTARCVFPHLKLPPVSRVAPGDSASRFAPTAVPSDSSAHSVSPERADAPAQTRADDTPPPLSPWKNPLRQHTTNVHAAAAQQDTVRSAPSPAFDAVPMTSPTPAPAAAPSPAPVDAPVTARPSVSAPSPAPPPEPPPPMPTAAPPPSPMAPRPVPQAASPARAAPVAPRPPRPPPSPAPAPGPTGRVRRPPERFEAGNATADNKARRSALLSTVLGGDTYREALQNALDVKDRHRLHEALSTAAIGSTAHSVFRSVGTAGSTTTDTGLDSRLHNECAWYSHTSRSGRQWRTSLQDASARFHQQGRPDMQEREFMFSAVDIHDDDRHVIREHLAAALGFELNITAEEWNYVKLFLTDMSKKERKKTKSESNIGESRSAGTYGMNADLDDTVMDLLLTQYLFNIDRENGEVILLVEDPFTLKIEKHKLLDLKDVPEEQHPQMLAAMAKEFTDLIRQGVFAGIECPANRKAISSRIVLKVKFRADGQFEKYKARNVAKGFLQRLGYDFFSTFSPMATLTTVRAIFAIAVHKGLPLKHSDIPQAFIKSILDTDVWMQLPPGISFIDKNNKVWKIVKLIRSLYGLRQAPALFHKELVRFMSQPALQFKQLVADQCVYFHYNKDNAKWAIVASEVDDLVITGDDDVLIARLKAILESQYEITEYEDINSFLGINIHYTIDPGGNSELTMDVTNKIESIFKVHAILKPICDMKGDVPINDYALNRPDSDEAKYNPMEKYIAERFASINGSIIYLCITCRPEIAFAIGKTSRGMHKPKPSHVASLKMLLAYLWHTRHFKLYYRQNGGMVRSLYEHIRQEDKSIAVIAGSDGQNIDPMGGFADANFANPTDPQRRSISGFVCFVFMCCVTWRSKLQTVTAGSTHEAELVAVALCSNEMVWIRKLLIEIGFAVGLTSVIREKLDPNDPSSVDKHVPELEPDFVMERNVELDEYVEKYKMDPPYLFNDNMGTVQTVNNPETKLTNKHIDTRYFATRKYVAEEKLRVAYVPTHINLGDLFTKALLFRGFSAFRDYIGVML